jgi:hypothetical protein
MRYSRIILASAAVIAGSSACFAGEIYTENSQDGIGKATINQNLDTYDDITVVNLQGTLASAQIKLNAQGKDINVENFQDGRGWGGVITSNATLAGRNIKATVEQKGKVTTSNNLTALSLDGDVEAVNLQKTYFSAHSDMKLSGRTITAGNFQDSTEGSTNAILKAETLKGDIGIYSEQNGKTWMNSKIDAKSVDTEDERRLHPILQNKVTQDFRFLSSTKRWED